MLDGAAATTFEHLAEMARAKTHVFSDIWRRSREEFGDAWVEELVDGVTRLFGSADDGRWEAALRGYAGFAMDAMRSQRFFESHKRYRAQSSAEIRRQYYENEDHMLRNYLPGLYLSHYLWPHHFRLLTFFRERVLPSLTPPPLFYDVGIGTGLYSREVLGAFPRARGQGFDISPYSIAFTRKLLEAYGVAGRYEFVLGDVFQIPGPPRPAPFLVSHEVLEHLEEPARFCRILYELTASGGRAYVTAAVNAAHSDHIYLFSSPDDVLAMLSTAGWKVREWHAEYAHGEDEVAITPCVVGALCER